MLLCLSFCNTVFNINWYISIILILVVSNGVKELVILLGYKSSIKIKVV
jgi:hypothetical protein